MFLGFIKIFFISTFCSLFVAFSGSNSFGAITLKIKNEELKKSRILIYGLKSEDPLIQKDVNRALSQIKENLNSTGLFEIHTDVKYLKLLRVDQEDKSLISNLLSIEKVPDFNLYRDYGVDALLVIDVNYNHFESKLELKARLWDVLDEKQLFGKFYATTEDKYKRMSNLISNRVYESITAEKLGHFNSQITYIAESGSHRKRIKRLVLMDFDGDNKKYLTNGDDLVLTPVFSKKPNQILFLRYFKEKLRIFNLDIENKIAKKLASINKTNYAPAIHPINPNLLLFSVIENGDSNIYEMNIYNNRLTKLTNYRGINTTPSYSPDGKKIVFSSNRTGTEKIYVMNYDGSGLRLISFGRGSYSKPVWSPDGTLIAFTNIANNRFTIGVMTPDGKNKKTITSAYLAEGARFSPGGRYLIYSKKTSPYGIGSVPKIYIIDIITGYERMLPTALDEGATDPDWSQKW